MDSGCWQLAASTFHNANESRWSCTSSLTTSCGKSQNNSTQNKEFEPDNAVFLWFVWGFFCHKEPKIGSLDQYQTRPKHAFVLDLSAGRVDGPPSLPETLQPQLEPQLHICFLSQASVSSSNWSHQAFTTGSGRCQIRCHRSHLSAKEEEQLNNSHLSFPTKRNGAEPLRGRKKKNSHQALWLPVGHLCTLGRRQSLEGQKGFFFFSLLSEAHPCGDAGRQRWKKNGLGITMISASANHSGRLRL